VAGDGVAGAVFAGDGWSAVSRRALIGGVVNWHSRGRAHSGRLERKKPPPKSLRDGGRLARKCFT
jgi:hypothetical protein